MLQPYIILLKMTDAVCFFFTKGFVRIACKPATRFEAGYT